MSAAAPEMLSSWQSSHRDHGRCGPFPDAKIHVWVVWRCPCGSKFYVDKDGPGVVLDIGQSRP